MKMTGSGKTIMDVARMANVSPSTVTHALNGKRPVKAETRARVMNAISALGYVPSWNASRLKGRFSGVIGCLATDISETFVNRIVRGIEQGLAGGTETLLFVSLVEFGGDYEAAFRFLRSHDIDGLLICHHIIPNEKLIRMIDNLPVVSINMELKNTVSVVADGESGGAMAAEHLYSAGMRKPAVISGPEDRVSTQLRYKGFCSRLKALSLPLPQSPCYGAYDAEHGYDACRELLRKGIRFDGLFAGNDYIAAGAINALHEHGIRVPEDVKVVGFDNRDFSSFWKPSITTFQQPLGEMGLVGIGVLRNLIANRSDVEMRYVLESRLIIRESSRRAERGSREVSDSEYQKD